MRVLVFVKATEDSEQGRMAPPELLEAMGKYNEELVNAGIMLGGEGLQPSSKGARVRFSGDRRTVIDGPFAETKELIAGFWLWQVKSIDEAVAQRERLGLRKFFLCAIAVKTFEDLVICVTGNFQIHINKPFMN